MPDKTNQELKEFINKYKGKREPKQYTREELTERYEDIVRRWQDDGDLIRLFPDKYEEICMKLEGLKAGANYRVYDATYEVADMVMDLFVKIGRIQQLDRFDESQGTVKDHRKSNYEYKTDIGDFVDKVVEDKLRGGCKNG